MSNRYLNDAAMNDLLVRVQELRKGHDLHPGAKAPYVVIVDGEYNWIKTLPLLRKFLHSCVFPCNPDVFRNRDKGVTINLDTY